MYCKETKSLPQNFMGRRKEQTPSATEREVCRFLQARWPTAEIEYEPETFFRKSENGNPPEGTTPDWRVNMASSKFSKLFIEVTSSANNGNGDPKARQKRVMRESAPRVPYIVLYREQLERIQRMPKYEYLGLDFALDKFPTQ